MPTKRKTGFDKFVAEQMKSPSFEAGYAEARAQIDAVDRLIRALDDARVELGMSKADLARRISSKPEIVRRLFTADGQNPTLGTIVKLAAAVGYKLELIPVEKSHRPPKKRKTNGKRAAA